MRTNQSPTITEAWAISCSSLQISNKHLLVSVDSFISGLVWDTKSTCQGGEPTYRNRIKLCKPEGQRCCKHVFDMFLLIFIDWYEISFPEGLLNTSAPCKITYIRWPFKIIILGQFKQNCIQLNWIMIRKNMHYSQYGISKHQKYNRPKSSQNQEELIYNSQK